MAEYIVAIDVTRVRFLADALPLMFFFISEDFFAFKQFPPQLTKSCPPDAPRACCWTLVVGMWRCSPPRNHLSTAIAQPFRWWMGRCACGGRGSNSPPQDYGTCALQPVLSPLNTFAMNAAPMRNLPARQMVPRGLEPRTLRLLAVRSNQPSYETHAINSEITNHLRIAFKLAAL